MLHSPMTMNVTNTVFLYVSNQLPLRLSKVQNQKVLTQFQRLFSEWGRGYSSLFFDYKGSQYIKKSQ
jgi:hypothetical protein